MVLVVSGASVSEALVASRGSMKKSSGSGPLLVTVTGIVTGLPAASVVWALSGSPAALALVALNLIDPVYGSASSLPTTGSVKATTRVQVPGVWSTVYAVSPVLAFPVSGSWFWP